MDLIDTLSLDSFKTQFNIEKENNRSNLHNQINIYFPEYFNKELKNIAELEKPFGIFFVKDFMACAGIPERYTDDTKDYLIEKLQKLGYFINSRNVICSEKINNLFQFIYSGWDEMKD